MLLLHNYFLSNTLLLGNKRVSLMGMADAGKGEYWGILTVLEVFLVGFGECGVCLEDCYDVAQLLLQYSEFFDSFI